MSEQAAYRYHQARESCVHAGHAGDRAAALKLYRGKLISYAQYVNAFSTGQAAAKANQPCPCEGCE